MFNDRGTTPSQQLFTQHKPAPQGLSRPHPFDLRYGTDTGIAAQPAPVAGEASPYEPVQPSIVTQAIGTLPQDVLRHYSFVDIGCGKGRAVLAAARFPFKEVIGIEIAPDLAAIAKTNCTRFAQRHPDAAPMRIRQGDACELPDSSGPLVLFLYNPFGVEKMRALADRLADRLAGETGGELADKQPAGNQPTACPHLFLIYHNPVAAKVLDASPHLQRWAARQFECSAEEKGYGYAREGATLIWQSRQNAHPCPHAHADAGLRVYGAHSTRLKRFWFDVI